METPSKKRIELDLKWTTRFFKGDKLEVAVVPTAPQAPLLGEPEKLFSSVLSANRRAIGRITRIKETWYVTPNLSDWVNLVAISGKTSGLLSAADAFKEGDWVWFELDRHPFAQGQASDHLTGRALVQELIASANHPFAIWRVAQAQQGLPLTAPNFAINHWAGRSDAQANRRDLRHLPFFTIDGAAAKDLDDALCIEFLSEDKVRLWVAIADPTAYLRPDDCVSQEASRRGMSQYFPGLCVPMLPKQLIEEHCSLRASVTRPAIVMQIELDASGALLSEDVQFELALIECQAQLAYNTATQWLEGHREACNVIPVEVLRGLMFLKRLLAAKLPVALERSSPWVQGQEYRFCINPSGKVLNIQQESSCMARQAVEKVMILSNFLFAKWATNRIKPNLSPIFSVNLGFDKKQFGNIVEWLQAFAPDLASCDLEVDESYGQIKARAFALSDQALQFHLSSAQAATHFSPVPGKHLAIGLPYYATWTSPLRRYQDFFNHWFIKSQIGNLNPEGLSPDPSLCKHLIVQKRAIRLAVTRVKQQLCFQYLTERFKKGARYMARVMKVTPSVCQLTLEKNGAVVLLNFDPKQASVPKLGQQIEVALWRFNSERSVIWVREVSNSATPRGTARGESLELAENEAVGAQLSH